MSKSAFNLPSARQVMAAVLDDTDRRIIYELDSNCRIPETRLAQIVGKSKESVRYRIRKLRQDGVIRGFTTYFDLTKLGLEAHKLYLRTREKPALMNSFLSHLRARPDVFWVGAGDGAWDVGLTFYAKDSIAFFSNKNELFSRFRELVVSQVVGTVVETHVFGKKFLIDEDLRVIPVRVLGGREENTIDARDLEIMRCLIEDGRMPYAAIASRAKISPEAVRGRVKAMEKAGIIARYTLSLDNQKLGYEFYKTFLYFEGLLPKEAKHLFELARRHPNVLHYLKVLAPWDVELEIMAANSHEYNRIINYFREQFSDVLVKVDTTVLELDEVFPSRKLPQVAD